MKTRNAYERAKEAIVSDPNEILNISTRKMDQDDIEALWTYAVSRKGSLLFDAPFHTYEMCLAAAENDGSSIRLMDDDYLDMKMLTTAIRQDPEMIRHIPNGARLDGDEYDELWMEAVSKNADLFADYPGTYPDVTYAALMNDIDVAKLVNLDQAIELMRDHPDMIDCLANNDFSQDEFDQIWKEAVTSDWSKIQDYSGINPDVGMAAINQDPEAAEYVSYELASAMIEKQPEIIETIAANECFVPEQWDTLWEKAVSGNGMLLEFYGGNSPDVINAAIANNPDADKFLDKFECTQETQDNVSIAPR